MTTAERHGGIYASATQRVIVISFETPEQATAWDALPEHIAFALLADVAAAHKAQEDSDEA